MADRPVLPWVRAAVFAAVCLTLAECAHRLMSPGAVPWSAHAFAYTAVLLIARTAATRERGPAMISTLMLLVQGGLHVWFNVAQHTAAGPTPAGACAAMAPMPGMDPAAMCAGPTGFGLSALTHSAAGMLLAHALAALAAAWWLRRGEAALFQLARVLVLVVHGFAVAVRIVCAPPVAWWRRHRISRVPATTPWRPRRLIALRYAVVRRGPPRVGVVA